MSLMKSMDKMLKNKAVLYGVVFLTVTNVFGYLMIRNYEAIVFFALVAYISSEFTKNNILVCLVALLMTNILLAVVQGRKVYESMKIVEGMEHGEKDSKDDKSSKKDASKDKASKDKASTEEPVVDESATKAASADGLVASLSDSKMSEHMANLDRIEGLLNKQEGLVGSLSKIENMMDKLEKMGAKRISRRDD